MWADKNFNGSIWQSSAQCEDWGWETIEKKCVLASKSFFSSRGELMEGEKRQDIRGPFQVGLPKQNTSFCILQNLGFEGLLFQFYSEGEFNKKSNIFAFMTSQIPILSGKTKKSIRERWNKERGILIHFHQIFVLSTSDITSHTDIQYINKNDFFWSQH